MDRYSPANSSHRQNEEGYAQAASMLFQGRPNNNSSPHFGSTRPPQSREYAEESPALFQRRSSFSMSEDDQIDAALVSRYNLETNEIELYQRRLNSFTGRWPSYAAVTPESIAIAGMSYKGPEDKVQCDECRGILYSFEDGDIAIDEHRKHFPLCQFLLRNRYEKLVQELQEQSARAEAELTNLMGSMSTGVDSPKEGISDITQHTTVDSPKESISDITQHTTFRIVRDIGYDEDIITRAFNILLAKESLGSINTDSVLDQIFQLEESGY